MNCIEVFDTQTARKPMEKLMIRFEKATEDPEKEAENAKPANMLESVLHKNRTLTLFGEINQDVARKPLKDCWRWHSNPTTLSPCTSALPVAMWSPAIPFTT